MSKATLLFLGSKPIGYHCLHYLLDQREHLNVEVSGVLTNNNSRFDANLSITKLAEQHNVPVIASLDEMPEVDYIYSVQYHDILKPFHIQKAKKIALNLHMAPLPEYRGCNQFSFAIAEGKTEFGTTIHQMDANIDHGAILFEKRFAIPDNIWVEELYETTFNESLDLFIETLRSILNGSYKPISQSSLINERGSSIHYRHEIQDLKKIDLNWDNEKIERHIRATYMPGFEPPYTIVNNERMYFKKDWK
jgi:methionyl-tRNA formyltransferase